MFGVEPGERYVGVERGFPFKAIVGHQFHAKQRHGQAGEVVVVDSCIDESRGKANLDYQSALMDTQSLEWLGVIYLPYVVLDCKFCGP